ncbi:hypothetical protein COT75_00980 [Candidatus Beckwithbacteria bacterium CG10_big_fil_rev_8_21_14_0_10_34_10]|uniref:Polymerase nucleotidyl transferase domain-containing protein n=1 Tax=Candidatus Beckwithbacteria bacterium CG10_big_fil_rev_8_21_14_0_10_34_10 TaxID=1974495 RepID=A0A2H0WCA7_9BACT|nr:MAG: hypothetical protein COT75_00980 [Candidatus Beckwithbacteria bacterium CG10_big_fil_rev_8_21_14_0_10_34_10]
MRALEKAVLKTLFYHQLFDYPLRKKEIKKLLIFSSLKKINKDIRKNIDQNLSGVLKNLVKDKNIKLVFPYYFLTNKDLSNNNKKDLVDLRNKRKKISQQKLILAKKYIKILSLISSIKMIGITGALAMENSELNDDIDLLIITQKNRLWLTRLLVVLTLEILNKRRKPNNRNIKDKFCLNIFLDEEGLKIETQKQNLFTAHEIVQMKVVLNKNKTYEKFIQKNLWLKKYLPFSIDKKNIEIIKNSNNIKEKEKKISFLNFLEKKAFKFQTLYMRKRVTRESINLHYAFFHPQNRSKEILLKFKRRQLKI